MADKAFGGVTVTRSPVAEIQSFSLSVASCNIPGCRCKDAHGAHLNGIMRSPITEKSFLSLTSTACNCKTPGCRCKNALASMYQVTSVLPVITHATEKRVVRAPVTRNHLIKSVSGKFKCEIKNCRCHELEGDYGNMLHDSIAKMVFKLAHKYVPTCSHDAVADLSQMCLAKVFHELHKFDANRGEFTTFVWSLCENALRRRYNWTNIRITDTDSIDEAFDIGERDRDFSVANDMDTAVQDLMVLYPKWSKALIVMFGGEGGVKNSLGSINLSAVAKASKCGYNGLSVFYRDVVRPFFIKRFKSGYQEESVVSHEEA